MKNQAMITRVLDFVSNHGGVSSDYYVGITNDVDDRLRQHGASGKFRVYDDLVSREDAKDTEQYLLAQFGFKGDTGGGESNSTLLYCFKL